MKYTVVCGISLELDEAAKRLSEAVNLKLEDGWMPLGMPFAQSQNFRDRANHVALYQAMVLPDIITHVEVEEVKSTTFPRSYAH